MSRPTLSLIISNYNHARYLPTSLGAMLQEAGDALELIVVDDASTDDSVAVIERMIEGHENVRFHRNARNRGVIANANENLARARGDYVYYGGADDRVLPGFVSRFQEATAAHPKAGIVFSSPMYFPESGTGSRVHPIPLGASIRYLTPAEVVDAVRRHGPFFAGHTACLRRQDLLDAGGFRAPLKWHIDWLALHVLAFRAGATFIPTPLAAMRVAATTYSSAGRADRAEQDRVEAELLEVLSAPDHADVREMFRRSGALAHLGPSILSTSFRDPRYRQWISASLVQRLVREAMLPHLARITPRPARRLYRRLKGRNAAAPAGNSTAEGGSR